MAYELKTPNAPASERQLGLLCRLTKGDWAQLRTNPEGWTMEQVAQKINVLMGDKGTKAKGKGKSTVVGQEISIETIIDRVILNKKELTLEYLTELVGKLKEKGIVVLQ